jgi:hypothetical protein
VQHGHKSGSLVSIEERMIPNEEKAVRGGLLIKSRETLIAEDSSLWLSKAGVERPFITNTRHTTIPINQLAMDFDRIIA